MAWTSPRTWAAAETVTAALMNTHVRDQLLHIAGTSGFTGTPSATRGIEPTSGYFMGAAAQNHHTESSKQTSNAQADTTIIEHTYTWTNAFASAPNVVHGVECTASTVALQLNAAGSGHCIKTGTVTTTGCVVAFRNGSGETVNMTTYVIAEGAD